MSSPLHWYSFKTSQRHTLHLIQSARYFSKIVRTYLHLGSLQIVFPVVPGDCSTIQIGVPAIFVPPGACIPQGTVYTAVLVIITILGGKWHTTMITKRITSGSCKN